MPNTFDPALMAIRRRRMERVERADAAQKRAQLAAEQTVALLLSCELKYGLRPAAIWYDELVTPKHLKAS
jgi:hypothetical protein